MDSEQGNPLVKDKFVTVAENHQSAYTKTEMQIICKVTAQLIRVYIFAALIKNPSATLKNPKVLPSSLNV